MIGITPAGLIFIGKYVEKFLQLKSENLTLEKLKELGF